MVRSKERGRLYSRLLVYFRMKKSTANGKKQAVEFEDFELKCIVNSVMILWSLELFCQFVFVALSS